MVVESHRVLLLLIINTIYILSVVESSESLTLPSECLLRFVKDGTRRMVTGTFELLLVNSRYFEKNVRP